MVIGKPRVSLQQYEDLKKQEKRIRALGDEVLFVYPDFTVGSLYGIHNEKLIKYHGIYVKKENQNVK